MLRSTRAQRFTMSSEPALLYEKSGGVATLTMNRPAVRNALNAEMLCRLAIAEVKWSLFPMGGSTARLPRQIAFCNAMEILLMGEQFSAADALRIGLINRIMPAAMVLDEARRCAEVICGNGPLAVQAVKRSVLAGLGRPTAEALEKEMEIGIPVSG